MVSMVLRQTLQDKRLGNPFPEPRDYIHEKERYMNAFKLNKLWQIVVAALFIGISAGAYAAKGSPGGGGGGGGGEPPTTETGSNNLSFPVILSDNIGPFPADGLWRFAPITTPETECIGEAGVTAGEPVPPNFLCYYGPHVTVESETGIIIPDGPDKVWWLQKRTQNFWKALTVGNNTGTPLVVSAVDVGDLLESTPSLATRQIRVEFNLLQNVPSTGSPLSPYLVADWTDGIPMPCTVPKEVGQTSIGCFAALGMSGAVPGTEQSGNEMQGTDFGPGPDASLLTGTQVLIDPTSVRLATTPEGTPIPIHALVYSQCARLVIQKIGGTPTWDKTTGQWAGEGVGTPLVNVATYSTTSPWSVEITSGGSIVYGYNWNAKSAATGTYRLTFVLDGNDAEGPQCSTQLATMFGPLGGTQLVNVGENFAPSIIAKGDSALGDEGGVVYIDIPLSTKGGGGRR